MKVRPKITWLISIFILILVIVVVGGITRLTNSGLSMVEWRLLYGFLPPLNHEEWVRVFDLYKQTPEFFHYNHTMDLHGFKQIFFWEYLHRVVGRVIGLIIILGGAILAFKKQFKPGDGKRFFAITLLVVSQGLLGWYMVKSGLIDKPDVSHFRLAAHLSLAIFLLQYILIWILKELDVKPRKIIPVLFSKWSFLILGLTSIQIVYGAFMAGLKAGYFFNTFPKMEGQWIPSSLFVLNPALSNFTNNPIMVQFIHRSLAWLILILIIFFVAKLRTQKLSRVEKISVNFLSTAVFIQFLLGVATLLLVVPVSLGVLHQLGGVILITAAVFNRYVFQRT